MPRTKKDPTEPTWNEVVRLERDVKRLKAKSNVLAREADEAVQDAQACVERGRNKDRTIRRLKEELAAVGQEKDAALAEARKAGRGEQEAHRQLGELEVRLARVLGRTYVISHSDEMATLVGALAQISDFTKLTLEREFRDVGIHRAGNPVEARLRQIVTICEQAIGKMASNLPPPKPPKAVPHVSDPNDTFRT